MRVYAFSGEKHLLQPFQSCFQAKTASSSGIRQEKAGSDLEFDREFAGTSTGNTPGINREIDREL
ncbi:hypothetical protein EBX31_10605 [bacterium]|nr:hypothetical protein [bacterium]